MARSTNRQRKTRAIKHQRPMSQQQIYDLNSIIPSDINDGLNYYPPHSGPMVSYEEYYEEEEDNEDSIEAACQEMEWYLRMQKYEKRVRTSEDDAPLKDRIDRIPLGIVAKLNVESLKTAVGRCSWCKSALANGISYLAFKTEAQMKLLMNTKSDVAKAATKKKIRLADGPPIITSMVSVALRYLWTGDKTPDHECDSLLQRLFIPAKKIRQKVGAFFVRKSNGKLRIIIDGRWTNTQFSGTAGKFGLFTLEALRQVIDNLSYNNAPWYAINLDLRHWFHQIPLPKVYAPYMAIPMTDRGNKGKMFLSPRAVPMGWTWAPYIAQCCTWALVLSQPDGQFFKREACLPPAAVLKQQNTPPTWIPLTGGGGIFVILDNILVVTPFERTADWWFNQIVGNAELHNARLKTEEEETNNAKRREMLKKECFFAMKKCSETSFKFLGVTWKHDKHCVEVKDEDKQLTTLPDFNRATRTFLSRRALASVLGKVMWHRRVHETRYFDGSEESTALLNLYSKVTPPFGETWNSPMVVESEEDAEGLRKAWEIRNAEEWKDANPLHHDGDLKGDDIAWIATDAASGTRLAAALIMTPSNKPIPVNSLRCERWLYPEEYNIAEGELFAIVEAVKQIARGKRLIVLATDSLNAKHWIERGHSKNLKMLKVLKELHEVLEENNCRLYLTYVPTKENVADVPSRGSIDSCDPILPELLESTRCYLEIAHNNAKGLWLNSGGITGGVKTEIHKGVRREREK